MREVRRGKINAVVVAKLDRLGRSLSHLCQLIDELTLHGTALIAPQQSIDTSSANPAGQLQLNILASVCQFERELIIERVNAGLAAAKKRGVKFGRPSTLQKHLPRVRALREAGRGVRQIARELHLPYASAQKICGMMSRRVS